jgi:hypothetical protein
MHKCSFVAAAAVAMVVAGSFAVHAETEDERVHRLIQPELKQISDCYLKFAILYGRSSCEAAAVVANAVLAKCSPEERRLSIALDAAAPYGKGGFNNSLLDGVRKGGKSSIAAVVLDVRAKEGICVPNRQNSN